MVGGGSTGGKKKKGSGILWWGVSTYEGEMGKIKQRFCV